MTADAATPYTKNQLLTLMAEKKAFPFHEHICKFSHLVPNQTVWLQDFNSMEMSVIGVGRREFEFSKWEPFYISNNEEPYFDERVDWEGQSDKRIQVYVESDT